MAQLIVKLKERELRRHNIDTRQVRIGRDAVCELAIDNSGISRLHAKVIYDEGDWMVEDAGSSNGLFVNGINLQTGPLREGDAIQVGKFEIIFTERGGTPVTDLADNADINRRRLKNPLATTALSSDDIERFVKEIQAARHFTATPKAHPPARRRPIAAVEDDAERDVRTFKTLATVFGLATLSLIGVIIYLLLD